MCKIRYVIVGSGWRSLYYVRVAKALPEKFELCAMFCRSREKAEKMSEEYGIYATASIEECRNFKPDFVVVAVNKTDIAKVSMEWMNYGLTVLCETPAALDTDTLKQLWELHKSGKKLVVAEQYTKYPTYDALFKVLNTGIIGEPDCLNISLAHGYHGASLMRAFLQQNVNAQFTVRAKTYEFTTVETLNRYERFTDGRMDKKKRTAATFEFDDGKVAFYDFDSEQYRSPIRKNHVKVQGRKGELMDDTFYYLDENYQDRQAKLVITQRCVHTGNANPNLKNVREILSINLDKESMKNETDGKAFEVHQVYKAPFGACGLAEDETAIARLMAEAAEYNKIFTSAENAESTQNDVSTKNVEKVEKAEEAEKAENVKNAENAEMAKRMDKELREALQDAYTAILMAEAVRTGKEAASEKQPWQYV